MSNKIVVVGSCMIDFISYASKLPKEGETVHGTKFVTGFGGKGANQCAAAAKLGGDTTFVARLGDDSWGHDYIKTLKKLNVDTSFVQLTTGYSSGIAQITVDDAGQNQIVVVGGANQQLNNADIENAKHILDKASVLVCQLEIPVDTVISALKIFKGTSILNGAPALSSYDPCLLTLPTIFCVNETEASVFTGLPVESVSDAKAAIKNLLERGCNTVLLTLGVQGALLASQKQSNIVHIPSPKVSALDTTGAGDAFIGALAYLICDYPKFGFEKSVEIACYMAADSVTRPGTQISFPEKDFLEKYIKDNNLC